MLSVAGSDIGFNAGSADAANQRAGYALIMTQIFTSTAGLTWLITEWIFSKQPTFRLGDHQWSHCWAYIGTVYMNYMPIRMFKKSV